MSIAGYVRVSGHRQVQTQTIEQQLESLQAHCQRQGWPWQEVEIFRDDGYSGAGLKRPGLDRLRDQVGREVYDRVLITAPDRLRGQVCPSGPAHRRVRARGESGGIRRASNEPGSA